MRPDLSSAGPHLPGRSGQRGGAAEDDRLLSDAMAWVTGTGAPLVRPSTQLRRAGERVPTFPWVGA